MPASAGCSVTGPATRAPLISIVGRVRARRSTYSWPVRAPIGTAPWRGRRWSTSRHDARRPRAERRALLASVGCAICERCATYSFGLARRRSHRSRRQRLPFTHVSMLEPSAPSPATHSQTLDRGLRALAALARHPDGLSVSELAAVLETHRAAVYRLLGPLGDHHLVR